MFMEKIREFITCTQILKQEWMNSIPIMNVSNLLCSPGHIEPSVKLRASACLTAKCIHLLQLWLHGIQQSTFSLYFYSANSVVTEVEDRVEVDEDRTAKEESQVVPDLADDAGVVTYDILLIVSEHEVHSHDPVKSLSTDPLTTNPSQVRHDKGG